jgi:serine protease Do
MQEEYNNNVYRWSIQDEENAKNNKNSKIRNKYRNPRKYKKSKGLRVFAAVMSFMFLISATATGYFILEYVSGDNPNNNPVAGSAAGEAPALVLSNRDAVEESQSGADSIEGTSVSVPSGNNGENNSTRILSTEEAIAKVNPSVVCIEVETEVQSFSRWGGRAGSPFVQHGIGTGFIVSGDGYIATNYHVVSHADRITVTLLNGEKYPAELIGGDEPGDLAIIKINATNLTAAELGDSDGLVQGQAVVAIGTPAGIEFAWTATWGIVSSVSRIVDVNGQRTMEVIQTDASINPGNSGGPLINMRGQVVGINSMKLASTQYEGMGFAIPINIAIPVFNDIIANPGMINESPDPNRPVNRSTVRFGLEGDTVSEYRSEHFNIPRGWQISRIVEDGPSFGSGLQISDIIVAIDDEPITSTEDMFELMLRYDPGDRVTVTIFRNGDLHDFDVVLGAR